MGLVGESGSGKTTLGRSILNLETLTSGEIFFEGKELTALTEEDRKAAYQQMQIIFQDPYSSLNPRMTALELVMEPLYHETKDAARAKAKEILAIVGITGDDVHKLPAVSAADKGNGSASLVRWSIARRSSCVMNRLRH